MAYLPAQREGTGEIPGQSVTGRHRQPEARDLSPCALLASDRMSQRHLAYMRVSDIAPAEVNPKLHDLPSLVASLHRFGFTQPGLMDERTARLCAGHGRREAVIWIKENAEAMPDGVLLDEDGEWMIPVIRGWSSRTDNEAMAYVVADNQLTIAGGWHMKSLGQLLEEVITDDAGVQDALGFDWEQVDEILGRINPENHNQGPAGWEDEDHADRPSAPDVRDTTLPDGDESVMPPRTVTCPSCSFQVPV